MVEIHIGECDKAGLVNNNMDGITKVFVIGDDLEIDGNKEHVKFSDVIMYKYFYRLLQEVNPTTMIVLNECLVKQNRYDLAYNCIRRYCLQTKNILVFNYYPIIRKQEDFMILYDMIQENPFLKESYKYVTSFRNVHVGRVEFNLDKTDLHLMISQEQYDAMKEEIISQVNKDPDIIPRRLYKWLARFKPNRYDDMQKIQKHMHVAVSQFGVDRYYYNELVSFRKELDNVIQRIS